MTFVRSRREAFRNHLLQSPFAFTVGNDFLQLSSAIIFRTHLLQSSPAIIFATICETHFSQQPYPIAFAYNTFYYSQQLHLLASPPSTGKPSTEWQHFLLLMTRSAGNGAPHFHPLVSANIARNATVCNTFRCGQRRSLVAGKHCR